MPESIRVSATVPASPEAIYKAWLSSQGHSAMTGSPATVDGRVGGAFTAWDGYIRGKTLELEPHRRIVQSWRTSDFPAGSHDSRLEVVLEEAGGAALSPRRPEPVEGSKGATRLTLVHTNIPDGQGDEYKQGWKEFYFKPMKKYFGGQSKT